MSYLIYEVDKLICKTCNIQMMPGTTYEIKDKRGISSRRFHECPKCHFRKYNGGVNIQEVQKVKN